MNTNDTQTTIDTSDVTFEAFTAAGDELEVAEFDNAPLTDINFGF